MKIGTISLLALAAIATSATAAERSGFYIGGDVGQSSWDVTQQDANNFGAALASGITFNNPLRTVTPTSNTIDDSDTTYSLFVGYQFVPWLAAEAAWMDLGKTSIVTSGTYSYPTVNPPPPGVPTGGTYSGSPRYESSGLALSVLPMLPIGDAFSLYARLGYYFGDGKLSGSYTAQDTRLGVPIGNPYNRSASDKQGTDDFLWGVGASWTWNRRISLRLEYDTIMNALESRGPYGRNDADVTRFTLGVAYRFGHDEAEAYVPAAAAPVAAVAAAPAKCADSDNDGVCDSADRCPNTPAGDRVGPNGCSCDVTIRTNFAFDSAVLTAEDKATLDGVAKRLKELQFVGGVANGHTDSVGDEAYNLKLSERRAQAVVDYLAALGVAPGRVKAVGYGESQPLADNSTEEGRAQNRRVTLRRTDCGPAN
jgi:outer membrane protein OmpA-like peptidoglycan-associated protein